MSVELLALARRIAIDAGELASALRRGGVEVAATKSSAVDIVTEADRQTEQFIRAALGEARPDDGILGEEQGGSTIGTSGLHWIVDPIDGTVNFLYGIPHYAVSIAVVEGNPDPLTWTGLAGCVVNPEQAEIYTGSAGGGAHLNGERIRVRPPVPLAYALVGTGFGYDAGMRAVQGEVARRLLPNVRDLRRSGSASLDLCYVAAGRLDAFYERSLSPWDYAAGAIIAQEAGATVTGGGGEPANRNLVLAAEPSVALELETWLDQAS